MELDREASGRITTADRIRYGRDRNEFDGNTGDASVGLVTCPSPPGRCLMLRLRNTLTRHVDEVDPLEPGRVRMYTCGPTVYRYAHVGNLRSNLLADLIRRTLLYHGLEVLHVKNITDVGHLRDEGIEVRAGVTRPTWTS